MNVSRILLLFVLAFCAVPASAAELTPEQAQSVWVLAWGQAHSIHKGDTTILYLPPVVNLLGYDQLCNAMARTPEMCGDLRGFQHKSQIYLLNTADYSTVSNAAIVFHEMIHYIQWMAQGRPTRLTCDQMNSQEMQARRMQAVVLAKAGRQGEARDVMQDFRMKRCL